MTRVGEHLQHGLQPVPGLSGGWLLGLKADSLLAGDGPGNFPPAWTGAGEDAHLPGSDSAGTSQLSRGLVCTQKQSQKDIRIRIRKYII